MTACMQDHYHHIRSHVGHDTSPCDTLVADNLNQILLQCHARRCKARKISVQGAVTATTMIAQAVAQAAKSPLPQTIIMQCPVDMRKQACQGLWPCLYMQCHRMIC